MDTTCNCLDTGTVYDPVAFMNHCPSKIPHLLDPTTANMTNVIPYLRNTYKQETARNFGEYGYGGVTGLSEDTCTDNGKEKLTLETCKALTNYKGLYGASYNDSSEWPVADAPAGCVVYGSKLYWNADDNDNDCGSDGINCVCGPVQSNNDKSVSYTHLRAHET